jgi:uncharacterized membrane protein
MSKVRKREIINATPEEVFDLVSDVVPFSRYSSFIKEITETPDGGYSWRVELLGMKLEWDAVITESTRPERFAWSSTSGVFNTGSYTIEPYGNKTRITFEMEFRMNSFTIGRIFSPVLLPVVTLVADDLLDNIKKKFGG